MFVATHANRRSTRPQGWDACAARIWAALACLGLLLLAPLSAFADLEQLPLDGIAATGCTWNSCTVANLDEDPTGPGTDWATATSNATSHVGNFTFPTPSEPLTTGAGLQVFRVSVREGAGCGTGTPTARIELWEAGGGLALAVGPDVGVTAVNTCTQGTDCQTISFAWDAALVASAVDVQARVYGDKATGSPATRCSVDLGAVEWLADVTPAGATPATLSSPTSPFANITSVAATLGATIDDDNGSAVTDYGTVWGASASPTGNALSAGTNPGAIPPALPFSHARDLSGQPAGTQVFFRGYADNGGGRAYSPDGSFYLEPNQATSINFTNVTDTAMRISWTLPGAGSVDGTIVVMKQALSTDAVPSDGVAHVASSVFGTGAAEIGTANYVVFRASGTQVDVTGLTPSTTYAVAVYTYAGPGAPSINYQQDAPQTDTQATDAPAATATLTTPTSPFANITAAGATLGATISNDNGDLVTDYGTVWGTAASPTGNALSAGTNPGAIPPVLPFSHARDLSAQTPGTQVIFRGYADNGAGRAYSPDGSFYLEPNQATGVSFSNVTDTGMRVSWTLPGTGAGDGTIVLMKQAGATDADPVDGTAHGASTVFGSGDELGTGNYVVFRASGTQVDVTGLTASTTYAVAIYTYAGSAGETNYQQDAPIEDTQATNAASALATLSAPTSPFANITSLAATLGATIDDDNGDAVTAYGTVWGAAPAPTGNALNAGTNPGAIPPALPFSHARDLSAQTPGTQVFFRGFADNGTGRAYSPDGSLYLEPNQATGVSFANVTAGGMQISWTLPGTGAGDGAIVVMKQGLATDAGPVDGTAHGASTVFGSGDELGTGNYVVFRATTGTLVNVTGLAAGTTYAVAIYTYAGSAAETNYQQDAPIEDTQGTLAGGAVPTLSTPTVTAVTATTAELGATISAQGGDAVQDYGIVWDTVSPPTANPVSMGSGPTPPPFVFTAPPTITGLPPGTLVTFRGYATNSSGPGYSSELTFQTEPATQAQTTRFESTRSVDTELDITWYRDSGDGVIVVMQESLPVDVGADPVDGVEYTANPVFGNGQELGTGNYVVYVGPASGVTVTGIFADITYHAAVYGYSGSGTGDSGINYIQLDPALGSSGHNASHGIDCVECHFGTGDLHGNFSVPRDSVQQTVCLGCHNESGPASAKKDVVLHTGPNYTTVVDCGSCHEIHNNFDFTTTDTHSGGVTAANVEWIRPNTTKYRATALEPALFQANTGFGGFGEGESPWNGICQTCHGATDFHRNDDSLGAGGHAHNSAAECGTCHSHADAFRGAGDCMGCHNQPQPEGAPTRRQIVDNSGDASTGEFGDAFTSHHVNDGLSGGAEIVTRWDCVVCHAEGDAVTGEVDGAYHQKDGVQLKDVDSDSSVVYSDWSGLTPVERSNFCLSCHDADGATKIAARPAPPPEEPDATNDPLNPFNDGVTNAHEGDGLGSICEDLRTPCERARDCEGIGGGTCNPLPAPHARGRCSVSTAVACGTAYECPSGETCELFKVVDVWSQVDPTQTAYHALESRSTPAYGSATPFSSPVDGAIKGVRTDLEWNSLINCEDCHYGTATTMLSGHGTANARYMLRDKDGNDTAAADPNTNCYRCHIPTGNPNDYDETVSAFNEHVTGSHIDDALTLFGIACLACHGGAEFGGIHGMSGPVPEDSDPSEGSYEPNVFTWGSGLDWISTWSPGVRVTCSSRTVNTLLNSCTQHGSTKESSGWRDGSTQPRTYRVP